MPVTSPTVPANAAPGLPLDGDEPVFHAPWQAKAFALTVSLHQKGLFKWGEWTEVFAARLRDEPSLADDAKSEAYAAAYYLAWVDALQTLIARHGVAAQEAVTEAAETWKRAAERTPHGTPILFETGFNGDR